MQRLFSPWRSKYIDAFLQPPDEKSECVLCKAYKDNKDGEHFIVKRGNFCYVVMNLFPYNSGHLMVVPYRHKQDFLDLSDEELLEIMHFLRKMIKALRVVSNPDGFNVGSNIGRIAGAGIAEHVHFHIVPRWIGDTNFMPVLADTKVISEDMKDTFEKLKKAIGD